MGFGPDFSLRIEVATVPFPYKQLLHAVLDIGEDMLNSGAEISRVEDSICRMCASYGVRRVNTFTITSNMIVTLEIDEDTVITQTRRIHPSTTDFTRLERLNALSRTICATQPSVEEIRVRYQAIAARPSMPRWLAYPGGALTASSFAVFFGGNWLDGIAAALLALLIEFLVLRPVRRQANPILYLFLVSLLTGCGGIALVKLGLGVHLDKILIGCIMLTIPGIAITNAVRDFLAGDIVSGLLRLCDSLLQAAGIACGFCLAIYLFGKGI